MESALERLTKMKERLYAQIEIDGGKLNYCKTYKAKATAEKVAGKLALETATYFGVEAPADWLVHEVDGIGRWIVIIDLTEVLARENSLGGYLAFVANKGHFSI